MLRPEQVGVAVEPVDRRLGIDGLSLKLQQARSRSPCDGSAYAFRNRNGTRIKRLIWDGTGVWLGHRRLHRGHFTWPSTECAVLALTATQWRWRITGVEWQRLSAVAPTHWRV
jgi:transposase